METSRNAEQTDTEVLIVGAGMTGLTLACDLLRRGIDFRIIDKLPLPFPGSRGKGLTPRSLEVLEDLGVIDQLLPYGYFHPIIRQYDGPIVLKDEDAHPGYASTPAIPYGSPFWMPQFRIEQTLREQLGKAGKQVEWATALTSIGQDDNGVTGTVEKEGRAQTVNCSYVVAADGGRSFVRGFLKVGFAGETRDAIRMLVGDVHADGLDHEHVHLWKTHPKGIVAMTPFPQTGIFQFQAQVAADFDEEPTLELFQQILQERTGMTIKLHDPTWLSSFKVNIRMVDRSVIGRVCIAGDAAHVHSPAGGQGMNTGIQDAYNLGWKLALLLRGSPAKLLETYQEERLPIAANVLRISTQMLDKFLAPERNLPSDSDRFQLNLNYRNNSLSEQATSLPLPLQAGDRAPDAPLQDGSGKPMRLFNLFRGPQFTLLYTGDAPKDDWARLQDTYSGIKQWCIHTARHTGYKGADCFVDIDGHFASAYGTQQNVIYLVRPDGYIGFIGDTARMQELTAYMDRLLGS